MSLQSAFQIFNGLVPPGVPKGIAMRFDISLAAGATQYIDLTAEEQFQSLEFVQGVWIDNADNPVALVLTFEVLGQRIIAPPLSQGLYSVFAPNPTRFTMSTTIHATAQPRIILTNVPVAPNVWKVA